MCVYVCVCVCMHVCMYVCMYVCMCIDVCVRMYACRRIRARFSFQGIMAVVFFCIGFNHLITTLFADITIIAGGMLVGGISLGLLAPNTNVWVTTSTQGTNRGRAVSIMVSVIFLAQFLTPFVSQPILRAVSFTGVFGYGAGISFLFSLILMIAHKRKLL